VGTVHHVLHWPPSRPRSLKRPRPGVLFAWVCTMRSFHAGKASTGRVEAASTYAICWSRRSIVTPTLGRALLDATRRGWSRSITIAMPAGPRRADAALTGETRAPAMSVQINASAKVCQKPTLAPAKGTQNVDGARCCRRDSSAPDSRVRTTPYLPNVAGPTGAGARKAEAKIIGWLRVFGQSFSGEPRTFWRWPARCGHGANAVRNSGVVEEWAVRPRMLGVSARCECTAEPAQRLCCFAGCAWMRNWPIHRASHDPAGRGAGSCLCTGAQSPSGNWQGWKPAAEKTGSQVFTRCSSPSEGDGAKTTQKFVVANHQLAISNYFTLASSHGWIVFGFD